MSVATGTRAARPAIAADRVIVPAKWWAMLGAAILAFQAFVLVRWLTGPYFKHVAPDRHRFPAG